MIVRRSLLIAALLLGGAVQAAAQTLPSLPIGPSGGGGGGGAPTTIANGTTFTGGADKQVCFNDGGTLSCGDAGLVYTKATGLLSPTRLNVTGAGAAATPSLSVGNVTTGLYSVSTTGLGFSVNGVDKLNFNVTSVNAWTIPQTATYPLVMAGTGGINVGGNGLTFGATQRSEIIALEDGGLTFGNNAGTIASNIFIPASASFQFGRADLAAPVAQTTRVQSVVAGTADTAGVNWTLKGSLSTGSGVSGDIIFQTGGTGAGSTTQNTATTALTIKGATQLVALPAITTDATHTDATVCEDTTSHALYFGSGAAGICLGTSSVRFKTDLSPLTAGLDQILRVDTVSYRYRPGYGDPSRKLYGFTAEQMAQVMPELVGFDADGLPNSVDWAGMVPVLVRAIQQQQSEIEELRHHQGTVK